LLKGVLLFFDCGLLLIMNLDKRGDESLKVGGQGTGSNRSIHTNRNLLVLVGNSDRFVLLLLETELLGGKGTLLLLDRRSLSVYGRTDNNIGERRHVLVLNKDAICSDKPLLDAFDVLCKK